MDIGNFYNSVSNDRSNSIFFKVFCPYVFCRIIADSFLVNFLVSNFDLFFRGKIYFINNYKRYIFYLTVLYKFISNCMLLYVRYAFQSESILCSGLNFLLETVAISEV